MEFQWSEAALVANDTPDNLDVARYISKTPRDNAKPSEAHKVAELATACGFNVTGIAATVPNQNGTEYTIPISIMESLIQLPVFYQIRIMHGAREQICTVGKIMQTLKSISNGSARNRLTMVIQDFWGQVSADGGNVPLTQQQVDAMIPGVTLAINGAAEAALAKVLS